MKNTKPIKNILPTNSIVKALMLIILASMAMAAIFGFGSAGNWVPFGIFLAVGIIALVIVIFLIFSFKNKKYHYLNIENEVATNTIKGIAFSTSLIIAISQVLFFIILFFAYMIRALSGGTGTFDSFVSATFVTFGVCTILILGSVVFIFLVMARLKNDLASQKEEVSDLEIMDSITEIQNIQSTEDDMDRIL